MSNLEYAVRQLCESNYTKELILESNSHTLAYSILSGKPLEEVRHIDPKEELNKSQLDDYYAINAAVKKLKQDLKEFNTFY